jgi:hypothetical protein
MCGFDCFWSFHSFPGCKLARPRRQSCVQLTDPLDAMSAWGATYLDTSGEQK